MIKEKVRSYINTYSLEEEIDSILHYNENGQIVYFQLRDRRFEEYKYDSNNILRYSQKKLIQNIPIIYYKIKTYNIKDTLSNAYAVDIKISNNIDDFIETKLLLVFYNNKNLISKNYEYIWNDSILVWQLVYNDSMVYNEQNQITEFYQGVGNIPSSKYQYKELYFYDDAGNKIRYEEHRKNFATGVYSPRYKEFYYYSNENLISKSEFNHLQNIKVYPNPVSDYLIIENNSIAKLLNYKIFNIKGELLDVGVMLNNIKQIDISFLPPAIYYIQLYSKDKNGSLQTIKIVKF